MREKISLPSYIRNLLLEEICKRMDIIEYCNQNYDLHLHRFKGSCYKGTCPYCRKKNVSYLHKRTGHFSCPHCRKVSDFFQIIGAYKDCDLNGTLAYISGYLEKAEELELGFAGGAV